MRLETPRLILRELALDDVDALHALTSDPEVVRFLSNDVMSRAETETYLGSVAMAQDRSPRHHFELAVIERESGAFAGTAGLRLDVADARIGKLWYLLRRESWGKGIAVEACRALADFGFRELGLHRLWVDVDPENAASQRVAEKLGMRVEGRFVEDTFLKGEWRSTVILAILAREWRP